MASNTSNDFRFDPEGWQDYRDITVRENGGNARRGECILGAFKIPAEADRHAPEELRIVRSEGDRLCEVPAQFYDTKREGGSLIGNTAFVADLAAGETARFRLYFGNKNATASDYKGDLSVEKGSLGPQHYFIENAYYKLETMPSSGQIWHMWNKTGANQSWHHYEWAQNKDKGGDPCHWAPNCWVAYPERITHGQDPLMARGDPDHFDWHYVFGWQNPETEIVDGPVFFETRRRGVVWPHPEHASPDLVRDDKELIRAEVVYRFYAGSPYIYQYSRLETLEDLNVFFIRNCQFVFLSRVFTHIVIAPDREGLMLEDEETPAVLRLMGEANVKPYDWLEHSLSNILPSKLGYYAYFNDGNHDGFALFQLLEEINNLYGGEPTYRNHGTHLTEVHDWSMYVGRTFSYTNRRFNPENATYLPKGETYEEENVLMTFRHDNLDGTLDHLRQTNAVVKQPPLYEFEGERITSGPER